MNIFAPSFAVLLLLNVSLLLLAALALSPLRMGAQRLTIARREKSATRTTTSRREMTGHYAN